VQLPEFRRFDFGAALLAIPVPRFCTSIGQNSCRSLSYIFLGLILDAVEPGTAALPNGMPGEIVGAVHTSNREKVQ
jgi:hypothetical protein